MTEKRGLVVESEPMAKVIMQALHSLVPDWKHIKDHDQLPPNLGEDMIVHGLDIAIIHANKPADQGPILSVVESGIPVVVLTRNESHGSTITVKNMYDLFRELDLPMHMLPINVAALQQQVYELLNPDSE